MIENTLDNYAYTNSIKDANVSFKVLFAILTVIVCLVSTSPVIPLTITFLMLFLIIFLAKIPFKFYLKFLSIPFIFGFMTFIFMTVFFGISEPWFNIGIFNLAVYKDGLNLGFLVLARIMGCFSCLGFLVLTTPINEIFFLLERFRIPKIIIEIAMMMYRYIFVFLDESGKMYNSQQTRLGYSSLKNTYRSVALLASNLFIKTWSKGEQLYITMESRCYNGSIKTFEVQKSIDIENLFLLLSFEFLLLLGVYLTRGFKVI
ncbi:MAG: cobalt ECF transporter T component CbiQ [Euryarchaeota archaeon]|nr:cobalt ECF transporter T component CbiQ [Euryarchaeota archaeon]